MDKLEPLYSPTFFKDIAAARGDRPCSGHFWAYVNTVIPPPQKGCVYCGRVEPIEQPGEQPNAH